MPSINWLLRQVATDYPTINFQQTDHSAYWSPTTHTVFYSPKEMHADWILLHELAHGILQHTTYKKDIELLAIERDAWQYAAESLAPRYGIIIKKDFIEDQLDSYRDWLHAKSSCPACNLNGVEIKNRTYKCLACGQTWQVNEARTCRIRRYYQSHTNTAP